jgi:hypothetical protein
MWLRECAQMETLEIGGFVTPAISSISSTRCRGIGQKSSELKRLRQAALSFNDKCKSVDATSGVDMSEYLPPIIIARPDYARLERVAVDALRKRHPVSGFLLSEIRRADVRDAYKVPRGVARLNEWVTYRIDDIERTESKILVCSEEFRCTELNLSVLSPLGVAVLGMRVA